jgi:phage terminase large subunit-like protein
MPACLYVKQACQRHLDDLANDSVLWPYTFDNKKANRICKIIELLPLVKGSKFAGKNLVLHDFGLKSYSGFSRTVNSFAMKFRSRHWQYMASCILGPVISRN